MTYYKDLIEIRRFHSSDERPALAVGWLSKSEPFTTGTVPDGFLQRLFIICDRKLVRQTRGWHHCEFCPSRPLGPFEETFGSHKLFLGSAEIQVEHSDGTLFASPNLIYHYIKTHAYKPPGKFIDAVMEVPANKAL